jgi:hypothetical protein
MDQAGASVETDRLISMRFCAGALKLHLDGLSAALNRRLLVSATAPPGAYPDSCILVSVLEPTPELQQHLVSRLFSAWLEGEDDA